MHILLTLALLISTSLMASETISDTPTIAADQKPTALIQCFSVVYPRYHTPQYGNPYMVQIKNVWTSPITVHPSVIQDIMPKEPIVEALKMKSIIGVTLLCGITGFTGLFTRFLFNVANNEETFDTQFMANNPSIRVYSHGRIWAKISLGVTLFSVAATALGYWNYCTIEADLDQNMLHTPIVLQPGEEVRKYFWPQYVSLLDSAAGIKFNLDAVEVIT